MKRNLILPIITCCATVAFGTALRAQDAAPAPSTTGTDTATGHKEGHHGDDLARLTKALNLTPDQQEKVKLILDTEHTQIQGAKQYTTLTRQEKLDKVKEAHETADTQINAVLTPDQQTKFASMQGKHEHHKEHGESQASPSASAASTP